MIIWWRRRPPHPTDEDLSAYLDEELPGREIDRVRTHLAACDACRSSLEALRSVRSMLGALPVTAAPRSFALSSEQAGLQAPSRMAASPQSPGRRVRVPAFAPAVALSVFLAVLAADLSGSNVSQQDESNAGAAMSAPVRSAYTADDAAKAAGTPQAVPQAAGALAPQPAQPLAESAAGAAPAPVAPVVPFGADSAAGAAPETASRSATAPAPSTGSAGLPEGTPVTAAGPGTAAPPGAFGTPLPSTSRASVPPLPPATGDAFAPSTDLQAANTDAASQIAIEPAQGGQAGGRQSEARDIGAGIDAITVLEVALFLLFVGLLVAVVWPRLFSKEVR